MTTATQINAKISHAILKAVSNGLSLREAVDAVLGAGSYDQLASDLYDALRAKTDANQIAVGTEVCCNGYRGRVTRICEWSNSMVEVRLARGTVCVDKHELIVL